MSALDLPEIEKRVSFVTANKSTPEAGVLALLHYEIDTLKLIAEVKRLAGTGWQPMKTAPRDRECLVLVKRRPNDAGKLVIAHYMPGGHCIEDHPPIDEGWYFDTGRMFDKVWKAVAWMPLPEFQETTDDAVATAS